MDLGWVTAIVTTVVGGLVTLATLWRKTAMAAQRDSDAADREDARRREDHARARRGIEREAVMRLVTRYQSTHTYAQTFTPRLVAHRIDTNTAPSSNRLRSARSRKGSTCGGNSAMTRSASTSNSSPMPPYEVLSAPATTSSPKQLALPKRHTRTTHEAS